MVDRMVDNITKYPLSKDRSYLFSIVIPSWNNFGYLKNCIESIHQHSKHQHQIIVAKDYGTDLDSFRESELLNDFQAFKKFNWQGATWPPVILYVDTWDLVGGFSTEFSPGIYSDPDLSFKLFQAGVREFMGVGSSLVYHFGSKSTYRVQKNRGRKIFLTKWGISSRVFRNEFLKIGEEYDGSLQEPDPHIRNRLINRCEEDHQQLELVSH